ncbi:MAG: hypothetical protein ACRD3B_06645, partial [Candidatus Sulfotelmatobacter sp.]
MRKSGLWGGALVLLGVLASSGWSVAQQNASPSASKGTTNPQPDAGDDPNGLPPRTRLPAPNVSSQENPADASTAEQPASTPRSPGGDQGMFVFKKQVEEVVLHATVVDDKQRLAAHLDRGAFTVIEDGQTQAITSFHREDV